MPSQVKEKEVVKYQWIKGDHQGRVETFDKMDGNFFVFESGKRCNKEVIGEFMMKVDLDNPVLQFEDPLGSIEKKQPHPPKKLEKNRKKLTNAIKEIKQPKPSPIIALLEKAKTKKTKLNTRIDMDLPSKEFIDVLQQSWDEDILSILSEHIYFNIDNPEEFLIERIKVALSEWFHNKPKTTRPKK